MEIELKSQKSVTVTVLKKTLCIFMTMLMLVSSFSGTLSAFASNFEIVDEGNCGDNVNWKLYNNNELIISGQGDMWDYFDDDTPFLDFSDIKSVVIEDGVTNIGMAVFLGNYNLERIVIPVSVTVIKRNAFQNTDVLSDIYYAGSEEQWNNINIGNYNSGLEDATVHFQENIVSDLEAGSWSGIDDMDNTRYSFEWDFIWYLNLSAQKLVFEGESDMGATGEGMADPFDPYPISGVPWLVSAGGDDYNNIVPQIKEVVIKEGIKNISKYAFYACDNLKSIVIPKSVTTVGYGSFAECDNLTDIYYCGTEEEWSVIKKIFYCSIPSDVTMHYNYEYVEHEHSYEKITRLEATCTEKGEVVNKCDCSFVESIEKTDKAPHSLIDVAAEESTCTSEGYTAGEYCTVCENWISGHEVLPKEAHTDENSDDICDICNANTGTDIRPGETKDIEIKSNQMKLHILSSYRLFQENISSTLYHTKTHTAIFMMPTRMK